MLPRLIPVSSFVAASVALAGPAVAARADVVVPRPNSVLTGSIRFPRHQGMTIRTGHGDGTRLTLAMGFDGRCTGGGLGEVWAAFVPVRETVHLKGASFDVDVTGASRRLGGVAGRTGEFSWTLTGRFVDRDTVTAKVTGSAVVRSRGKVISRCRITKPASVKLTA
jgi:hypothetical protein